MKNKAVLSCQGEQCSRDAVSTHVIRYRGLQFHLALCEEHGAELEAAEKTEAAEAPIRAAEEMILITHGQETIAQICYTHRYPAITIAFPEEEPVAEHAELVVPPSPPETETENVESNA